MGSSKLTYFKLWNGDPQFTKQNCEEIIPHDVLKLMGGKDNVRYSPNTSKPDFTTDTSILDNIQIKSNPSGYRGGYNNRGGGHRGGYQNRGGYKGGYQDRYKSNGYQRSSNVDDDGFVSVQGRKKKY